MTMPLERGMRSPVGFCKVDSIIFRSSSGLMFWGVGRQSRVFNMKLSGVFGVEALPRANLHGVGASDAANGTSTEKAVENIETNVPAGGTPRNEAAIDLVPESQARAATGGFEFPPDVTVLKHRGNIGLRHRSCLQPACSRPGEIHSGSGLGEALIGLKGRPFAQLCRISECLPDFFRRVAQFPDENKRPLLSVFSYLRSAGRAGRVLLAIGERVHLAACELRDLNEIAAGVVQHRNGCEVHIGGWHGELGAASLDSLVVACEVVGEEHGGGLVLLENSLLICLGGGVVI